MVQANSMTAMRSSPRWTTLSSVVSRKRRRATPAKGQSGPLRAGRVAPREIRGNASSAESSKESWPFPVVSSIHSPCGPAGWMPPTAAPSSARRASWITARNVKASMRETIAHKWSRAKDRQEGLVAVGSWHAPHRAHQLSAIALEPRTSNFEPWLLVATIDTVPHFLYNTITARGACAESPRPDGRGNPLNLTRVIPA